jgi:hypothetical protein
LAKHLTERDVDAIVEIIRGWRSDRLTWEQICESAVAVVGAKTTRQTLNAHPAIKAAYTAKKAGLEVHGPRTSMPSSLAVAAQRIARQQSVIDELKATNSRLLEQFVKWQYNACKHGLKEYQLNEELPRIDRERTDGRTSIELAK